MKYITLIASETRDGKKVEIGKQEQFPIAVDIADVIDMVNQDNGWNNDEIVACFNYGSRVKRQTQLRALAEAPTNVKIFKGLSEAKQNELLREHGLL